jgi:hypothetical protein
VEENLQMLLEERMKADRERDAAATKEKEEEAAAAKAKQTDEDGAAIGKQQTTTDKSLAALGEGEEEEEDEDEDEDKEDKIKRGVSTGWGGDDDEAGPLASKLKNKKKFMNKASAVGKLKAGGGSKRTPGAFDADALNSGMAKSAFASSKRERTSPKTSVRSTRHQDSGKES